MYRGIPVLINMQHGLQALRLAVINITIIASLNRASALC